MRNLFDNYIMVDWSASSKANTGADSIWIGVLRRDVRRQLKFEAFNPSTRIQALEIISSNLEAFENRGDLTIVGFDFSLAYPRGTAAAMGLKDTKWSGIYDFLSKEIRDKADNDNNRFQVAGNMNFKISNGPFPFWGCPKKFIQKNLQPTQVVKHDSATLPEYRICETRAKASSSCWKLYAPGAVGSQTLMGIPYVSKLKAQFPNAKIWPMETGFDNINRDTIEDYKIVFCEIYPSLIKPNIIAGEAKDLSQIRTFAEYIANLDDKNKLHSLLGLPKNLSDEEKEIIINEEGWILGVE